MRQNSLLGVQTLQRPLLEVRMHLDLVDRRHDRRLREQEIDPIDTKLAGALVERVKRGVVAVVADHTFVSMNMSSCEMPGRRIPKFVLNSMIIR